MVVVLGVVQFVVSSVHDASPMEVKHIFTVEEQTILCLKRDVQKRSRSVGHTQTQYILSKYSLRLNF